MAVTVTNLTKGTDIDGNSTATTASVSPASNALLLLKVSSRTSTSTDPAVPSITGNGLTWVQINSIVFDTTGASRRRETLFRAMGASPSSGTISIDYSGVNQDVIEYSLDQATSTDTSGTNGSGAIVQSATNKDEVGSTSFTVTLAAFSDTNNATYGAFSTVGGGDVFAAGTGFTLTSTNQTGAGIEGCTEFKSTNDTTVDVSVTGVATNWGGIAIEIKAATTAKVLGTLTMMGVGN